MPPDANTIQHLCRALLAACEARDLFSAGHVAQALGEISPRTYAEQCLIVAHDRWRAAGHHSLFHAERELHVAYQRKAIPQMGQ